MNTTDVGYDVAMGFALIVLVVMVLGAVLITVCSALERRGARRIAPWNTSEDLASVLADDRNYRDHAAQTGHLLHPLSACPTCHGRAIEIKAVKTRHPYAAYVLHHHPGNVTTDRHGRVVVTCPICSMVSMPWHPSSRGADAHRFNCTIDAAMQRDEVPAEGLPYPVTDVCSLCDEPITMRRGDDSTRHDECVTKHVDERVAKVRDDLIDFAHQASEKDLALRLIGAFDADDHASALLTVAAYRLVHDPSDERREAFARALEDHPDAPLRSLLETSSARRALMTADLLRMFDADVPAIRDEIAAAVA